LTKLVKPFVTYCKIMNVILNLDLWDQGRQFFFINYRKIKNLTSILTFDFKIKVTECYSFVAFYGHFMLTLHLCWPNFDLLFYDFTTRLSGLVVKLPVDQSNDCWFKSHWELLATALSIGQRCCSKFIVFNSLLVTLLIDSIFADLFTYRSSVKTTWLTQQAINK